MPDWLLTVLVLLGIVALVLWIYLVLRAAFRAAPPPSPPTILKLFQDDPFNPPQPSRKRPLPADGESAIRPRARRDSTRDPDA